MKRLWLLMIILFLGVGLQAQTKSLRAIYKDNPKKAGIIRVKVPGWVARLGVNKAMGSMTIDGVDGLQGIVMPIVNRLKNFKLLMVNGLLSEKTSEKYKNVNKELERKNYKQLIYIRSGSMNVNVQFRQKKKKKKTVVKDIVVIVKDGEEQLIIGSVKGRWTNQIFKNFNFLELLDGNFMNNFSPFGGGESEEDDTPREEDNKEGA